jgi:uncharacterized protein (DUF433 family)
MAYSTQLAAALSGATVPQLRHWRRDLGSGALLRPELAVRPRSLYSFRDVLALRTCVYLRKDITLQKIRTAVATLRRIGEVEHLSAYRLVVDGDSIAWDAEPSPVDLVKRPGQHVIATMADILEPFAARPGVVVPRLFRPREHVSVDPETRGGQPIITGTRVSYEDVAQLIDDGVAPEEIAEFYPSVSAEAARDAADFALYVASFTAGARAA